MKRILIAPLDWGLGHATRCVPIIRELIKRDCEVYLAGTGDSLQLLRKEFPQFPAFILPGYRPAYPSSGSMVWKMIWQVPKFMMVIRKEHRQIEDIIESNKIDLVISDNRYGCWSRRISSVFITHQRNILMPSGFRWLAGLVNRLSDSMIRNFTCCWIPDFPDASSLAGILTAHGANGKTPPTKYIGTLSRFHPIEQQEVIYDVLCVLSGPEPQRTIFEQILVNQLRSLGLRFFVVRGVLSSSSANRATIGDNCTDYLSGDDLQTMIGQSACVVARSGYSTIMDLARLGGKAILVPTPGQTEQEYLASRLTGKKVVYSMEQNRFDLSVALKESKSYSGFERTAGRSDLLIKALDQLLLHSRQVLKSESAL